MSCTCGGLLVEDYSYRLNGRLVIIYKCRDCGAEEVEER